MDNLRLITIPISHYCEKTRWALDRLGLSYREERHIQGFHYIRSYMTSGGPNVPVLIDENNTIADSTAILKHLDQYASSAARLYPDDEAARHEVEQLEDLFDEQLGVDSRRWMYYQMRGQTYKVIYDMSQGVPIIEKLLMPAMFPLMYLLLRSHPDILTRDVEQGLIRAKSIVSQMDELLSDGRAFLVGNRFTAADLSFACMMSPFLVPAEYGIRLPELHTLPTSMRSTVNDFRNTRSGRHALKMFKTQRQASQENTGYFIDKNTKEIA